MAVVSNKTVRYLLFVIAVPIVVLLLPKSRVRDPLAVMLLGVPLLLGLVPRNWFYGMRSCYALSSDEAWYRQNVITGAAMLLGSAVWMLAIVF